MDFYVGNLNITASLTGGGKKIINSLTFGVRAGEPMAIVGDSGCGKTMTALSVFGLLPENCAADGNILLNGKDLLTLSQKQINKMRGRDLIYIPQSGADFLNPSLKIKSQLYESLEKNGVKDRIVKKFAALDKLRNAGFGDDAGTILEKYPFQLSGGQAQRAVLAISLCGNPGLVIADEPTKGIDDATAEIFLDKLLSLFPDAVIVVITHNISVAAKCEKILVMHDGEAVEYGDASAVLGNPVSDYTRKLLSALPTHLGEKNA